MAALVLHVRRVGARDGDATNEGGLLEELVQAADGPDNIRRVVDDDVFGTWASASQSRDELGLDWTTGRRARDLGVRAGSPLRSILASASGLASKMNGVNEERAARRERGRQLPGSRFRDTLELAGCGRSSA